MNSAAITTPHPLATAAGEAVLRKGGTAIEAVIAAGAVLAVVNPHFCGLGGDAVWVVSDHQGQARVFLAIGQALAEAKPQGVNPSDSQPFGSIPTRGAASVLTTAALVDGWRLALSHSNAHWGGTAALSELLAPAIAYAAEGFTVTASQEFWGDFRANESADWPGFAALFRPEGAPLRQGAILRQPALADVLSEIAEFGPETFYHGALAARIVAGLQAAGVPITAADLAATKAREVTPLTLDYKGYQLLAPPPPTQGCSTLAIMGVLAHLGLDTMEPSSVAYLHACVEAVKRAFAERGGIADPDFSAQPVEEWLSPALLAAKAAQIDPAKAAPWPEVYRNGDTVFLAATDAAGNAASVLQSTYFDWGSGVVAGDTGILWQNRGAAFSLDPNHPNAYAPGKLPFYTLNPGMALKAGRPALLYGTQGADGQPQTLSVLLSQLIDFNKSPQEALDAPRFLLGRTFSDSRDSLKLEADWGAQTFTQMREMGHEVAEIAAKSPLAGLAGVICLRQGLARAAHDPRGENQGRGLAVACGAETGAA